MKDPRFRQRILDEIVSTERTFVKNLKTLIDVFIDPLESKEFFSKEDMVVIFSNWKIISGFNQQLLKDLEDATNIGVEQAKVGALFKRYAPFFRMFAQYVGSFDKALEYSTELAKKQSKFAAFLEEARKDPRCQGLDLSSFLIMPVQRIPRYKLLLQSLIDHTPPEHHDFKDLSDAINLVSAAALHNNEHIRKSQNMEKLTEIQMSLDSDTAVNLFDSPTRVFVREGVLNKLCRMGPKRFQFWLFNDRLLYGQRSGLFEDKYTLHRAIDLGYCKVLSIPEEEENSDRGFIIQTKEKTFVVWAKDSQEQQQWVKDINTGIDACRKRLLELGQDQSFSPTSPRNSAEMRRRRASVGDDVDEDDEEQEPNPPSSAGPTSPNATGGQGQRMDNLSITYHLRRFKMLTQVREFTGSRKNLLSATLDPAMLSSMSPPVSRSTSVSKLVDVTPESLTTTRAKLRAASQHSINGGPLSPTGPGTGAGGNPTPTTVTMSPVTMAGTGEVEALSRTTPTYNHSQGPVRVLPPKPSRAPPPPPGVVNKAPFDPSEVPPPPPPPLSLPPHQSMPPGGSRSQQSSPVSASRERPALHRRPSRTAPNSPENINTLSKPLTIGGGGGAPAAADSLDQVSFYPYSQLMSCSNQVLPPSVDPSRREKNLDDTEFMALFKCNKADFQALPKWKQVELKKALKLF